MFLSMPEDLSMEISRETCAMVTCVTGKSINDTSGEIYMMVMDLLTGTSITLVNQMQCVGHLIIRFVVRANFQTHAQETNLLYLDSGDRQWTHARPSSGLRV